MTVATRDACAFAALDLKVGRLESELDALAARLDELQENRLTDRALADFRHWFDQFCADACLNGANANHWGIIRAKLEEFAGFAPTYGPDITKSEAKAAGFHHAQLGIRIMVDGHLRKVIADPEREPLYPRFREAFRRDFDGMPLPPMQHQVRVERPDLHNGYGRHELHVSFVGDEPFLDPDLATAAAALDSRLAA
jgi:hypothetical protein